MRDPIVALGLAALCFIAACGSDQVTVPPRSLARSGTATFLCMNTVDGDRNPGRHIDKCPDFDVEDDDLNLDNLMAMVTQRDTGEVAVIDITVGSIVDQDTSKPGFNFLPVGDRPTSIASTPGGTATFVGVAELGREGIYALPTSCIRPPARDLTAWPACSLPSAPGAMKVLVDPAIEASDGGMLVRASCDAAYDADTATVGTALGAGGDCPADLAREVVDPGRRKLLVAMPEEGVLAVIDAQQLLDRPPGSFDACPIERWVPLEVALPNSPPQQIPPLDLVKPGCDIVPVNNGPDTVDVPRPAGLELDGDSLYVADQGAPVVHVLDVSDPCTPIEEPPLLPVSWLNPGRTVTTSDVAVSPFTTQGKKFVYAIDEFDDAGSVMVFDVTPGSSNRTPLVRPRSSILTVEPPDRIKFQSAPRDLAFVLRDEPIIDATTGVAVVGTACDPNPALDPGAPAAQYRSSRDLSTGARPGNLRGVFGLIALTSGQIMVIDTEDFDARCRRPVETNRTDPPMEDFRGCADPSVGPDRFENADGPTVTNEATCQVVQPHRARAARFTITDDEFGANAPGLRTLPQLTLDGAAVATGQTDEGRATPKMLGVPFATGEAARVFVSTTQHIVGATDAAQEELLVSPAEAERNSVTLNLNEPRVFVPQEDFDVVFEGATVRARNGGIPSRDGALVIDDDSVRFCARGVRDVAAARVLGRRMGVADNRLDAFGRRHADYVEVVSTLLDEDDSYWSATGSAGRSCGTANDDPEASRRYCDNTFGETVDDGARKRDGPRDFRVLEAFQDSLAVESRNFAGQAPIDDLRCCFPQALRYRVRASHQWIVDGSVSGFPHHMVGVEDTDGRFRCVEDCSPIRERRFGRVFEISCEGDCGTSDTGIPAIGPTTGEDVACMVESVTEVATDPSHPCAFHNTQLNFAIYRGARLDDEGSVEASPSRRGMVFSFTAVGGFAPLFVNLASQTSAVSTSSMFVVPQLGELAVVDGAAEGLGLVNLDSIAVRRIFF